MVQVFHSPRGSVWGHFRPVDMRSGLRSFWALGWCLGCGDLGRDRERWLFGGLLNRVKKFIL